ncbi:MAG: PHP domain-containing protein [Clostridia bacterium]|nr:PHP domain-containing protein [Clostridia bacterium]
MAYKKEDILNDFDIFPKVFAAGKEALIHIRQTGGRPVFAPDTEYGLTVCAMDQGRPRDYPRLSDFRDLTVKSDGAGDFAFRYTFDSEQEYLIRVFDGEGKRLVQLSVYCVEGELAERYPFIGDLHIHTTRSDGGQIPAVVTANYRKYGYDFMVVSDHGRYYPSLEARDFYKDLPIALNIVPGEEIHLPAVNGYRNDVHIVNFGGEYSINALIEGAATAERGKDLSARAIRENDVPDVMTVEEFMAKMQTIADTLDVPDDIEPTTIATYRWIFDEIRKGNGLGIFAHPNWLSDVYQVPERFTDYMMEQRFFDAFEVLGGENYFEQNGFQTARYYEERAKGNVFPVVGSTDSHSSYESNRNAFICATMVFARENERTELIRSIKDLYSVAIDTISAEFRLVGERRLIRYACFLLKNYFPIHDELCYEEGRLMKQYATGTEDEKKEAAQLLTILGKRTDRLLKKYFAF